MCCVCKFCHLFSGLTRLPMREALVGDVVHFHESQFTKRRLMEVKRLTLNGHPTLRPGIASTLATTIAVASCFSTIHQWPRWPPPRLRWTSLMLSLASLFNCNNSSSKKTMGTVLKWTLKYLLIRTARGVRVNTHFQVTVPFRTWMSSSKEYVGRAFRSKTFKGEPLEDNVPQVGTLSNYRTHFY